MRYNFVVQLSAVKIELKEDFYKKKEILELNSE